VAYNSKFVVGSARWSVEWEPILRERAGVEFTGVLSTVRVGCWDA